MLGEDIYYKFNLLQAKLRKTVGLKYSFATKGDFTLEANEIQNCVTSALKELSDFIHKYDINDDNLINDLYLFVVSDRYDKKQEEQSNETISDPSIYYGEHTQSPVYKSLCMKLANIIERREQKT